jgi:type I restriction enzyme S subunit
VQEQQKIATHISANTNRIDGLVELAVQAITLLQERRTALISAAVTGQIDVRGAASVQAVAKPTLRVIEGGKADTPSPEPRPAPSVSRLRLLVAARIVERLARQPTFGRTALHKHLYLAQTHLGIEALDATFLREAAGPLDRVLQTEVEQALSNARFARVHQDGHGAPVTYTLLPGRPDLHGELIAAIGADKARELDALLASMETFKTQSVEAVATLYAVWNDALIDGTPTNAESLFRAIETDWHENKNLPRSVLTEMLPWMERQRLVPSGQGRRTVPTPQGSLF